MIKNIECKCGYNGIGIPKKYDSNCFYNSGTHIRFLCPKCKEMCDILYSNKDGSYIIPKLLKRNNKNEKRKL